MCPTPNLESAQGTNAALEVPERYAEHYTSPIHALAVTGECGPPASEFHPPLPSPGIRDLVLGALSLRERAAPLPPPRHPHDLKTRRSQLHRPLPRAAARADRHPYPVPNLQHDNLHSHIPPPGHHTPDSPRPRRPASPREILLPPQSDLPLAWPAAREGADEV